MIVYLGLNKRFIDIIQKSSSYLYVAGGGAVVCRSVELDSQGDDHPPGGPSPSPHGPEEVGVVGD